MIYKGYLKKSKQGKRYDNRYFKIIEGVLYWYEDETSREIQNKLKISEIEDVEIDKENENIFSLLINAIEGGKNQKTIIYTFKAENN